MLFSDQETSFLAVFVVETQEKTEEVLVEPKVQFHSVQRFIYQKLFLMELNIQKCGDLSKCYCLWTYLNN